MKTYDRCNPNNTSQNLNLELFENNQFDEYIYYITESIADLNDISLIQTNCSLNFPGILKKYSSIHKLIKMKNKRERLYPYY